MAGEFEQLQFAVGVQGGGAVEIDRAGAVGFAVADGPASVREGG